VSHHQKAFIPLILKPPFSARVFRPLPSWVPLPFRGRPFFLSPQLPPWSAPLFFLNQLKHIISIIGFSDTLWSDTCTLVDSYFKQHIIKMKLFDIEMAESAVWTSYSPLSTIKSLLSRFLPITCYLNPRGSLVSAEGEKAKAFSPSAPPSLLCRLILHII